ncbi:MAG: polysaccharide biosynthesis C-terminal domain-containing protein [Ruminococcus sp.]|nr:polysaccharide biosynthesis C-terminal domain-containing protein [Ruminococcus sp.]
MADTRKRRAILNTVFSLVCQGITLLCGFIVPRCLIKAFGSEIYGATASITQFLGYIVLLEGGIGAVAKTALYKPLADNDMEKVGKVLAEVRRFFHILVLIFIPYVIILAAGYKSLSRFEAMNRLSTAVLVIVISLSTFAQYYIGITYSLFLQAAQKAYITHIITIGSTALNTIAIVLLINLGQNIIIVKLASSCVFILKPVCMMLYVKKRYKINTGVRSDDTEIQQKWSGLGQHIAFFIYSNTDTAVLTITGNLTAVSVYSVYNMVVGQLRSLTSSIAGGMESLFGDMVAKKEMKTLYVTFSYYETLISFITNIVFSTAMVMIVPFVKIYTASFDDANYIEPLFGGLLMLSAVVYLLRLPYMVLIHAAGHFSQTAAAAYGEAIINIVLSLILVHRFQLPGIAAATLIATAFRFVYYVVYLKFHILERAVRLAVRRLLVNALAFSVIFGAGNAFVLRFPAANYPAWALRGAAVFAAAGIVTTAANFVFYRDECLTIGRKLLGRGK